MVDIGVLLFTKYRNLRTKEARRERICSIEIPKQIYIDTLSHISSKVIITKISKFPQ